MSFIPKPHEIYKHFKGNLYQIVTIAQHSETDEQLVIYQALYGDFKTYARPLEMFIGKVDREKYPDACQTFRFELQGEGRERQFRENGVLETALDDENAAESEKEQTETAEPDPMVLEFLDSDSYAKKLNILAGLRHRITDDMITTMAVACDIEVEEGDTQKRYDSLRKCLQMLDKYECSRLR
ncbi:MAG: DUF1653 domain-containing protein [Lachnospiraceae bacterium]|nr:DUF1653 domain-containing protein [Lachnospiraceae bacterium]